MQASSFDESEFFRAIDESGARAILIGRRALVALGVPVLTADYDFWIDPADVERFNDATARFDLCPNRTPDEARSAGRYVLENDEHVDVLVARSKSTVDGRSLDFEDAWIRRQVLEGGAGWSICVPCIDDLILTKLWAARARDLDDIQLLQSLKQEEG